MLLSTRNEILFSIIIALITGSITKIILRKVFLKFLKEIIYLINSLVIY